MIINMSIIYVIILLVNPSTLEYTPMKNTNEVVIIFYMLSIVFIVSLENPCSTNWYPYPALKKLKPWKYISTNIIVRQYLYYFLKKYLYTLYTSHNVDFVGFSSAATWVYENLKWIKMLGRKSKIVMITNIWLKVANGAL